MNLLLSLGWVYLPCCWSVKVSSAFVMQAEVLMHTVARVSKAFMVQTAVGPLAEDHVAAGSCGSSQSFDRGLCGSSVEAVGSLEEFQVAA